MAINQVSISGNLTRDAELKATKSGTSVLDFTVAVNDRTRDAQGNWVEQPNFIDVTVFGKRAESLAQYLKRGLKVAVSGRLHYSSWQGNDGSKRSKIEVIASEIEFMTARAQSGSEFRSYTENYR